jgi:predicted RNA-binding protein
MSEFAFFRFKSANMLSEDEERDKQEMITLTEQVLDAKGIECDARIAKISEDKLREILEEVRKLRKKKMNSVRSGDTKSNDDRYIQNEEGTYIQ